MQEVSFKEGRDNKSQRHGVPHTANLDSHRLGIESDQNQEGPIAHARLGRPATGATGSPIPRKYHIRTLDMAQTGKTRQLKRMRKCRPKQTIMLGASGKKTQ